MSLITDFFAQESTKGSILVGSNVLGSFRAFCCKFCKQVTTGANLLRFFCVSFHLFRAKVAEEAIAIFLLAYFIIDLFCASGCGSWCFS